MVNAGFITNKLKKNGNAVLNAEKRTKSIGYFLIISLFFIFPFGQLLRVNLSYSGNRIILQSIDVFMLIFGALYIWSKGINKNLILSRALIILIFSFVLSTGSFYFRELIVGLFYLIRLVAYYFYYRFITQYLNEKKFVQKIFHYLSLVSLLIAVIGLFQYVYYPDLTRMGMSGWDGHLYRLVGSFFDPGYTGMILVLGFIVTYFQYTKNKKKIYLLNLHILLTSLLLTYSRASYLAYVVSIMGLMVLSFRKNLVVFLLLFLIAIPLLPRPAGVGVKLERTDTIVYRENNYIETLNIWKENPIFGVGYNNLCAYRTKNNMLSSVGANSCSGADSSLLFVLATTGFVGFIVLFQTAWNFLKTNLSNTVLVVSLFAVVVHSMFSNTLFYPWVVIWLLTTANRAFPPTDNK